MKHFGLIGLTLSHSFSEKYFTSKFHSLEISDSNTYQNFEIKSLDEFFHLIGSDPLLNGLNVTIPYKEKIIPYLDSLDKTALETGAVNTVKITRNSDGTVQKITGYNTDVTGFYSTFIPLISNETTGALILGSGGASKAVEWVLKDWKIPYLVVSRNKKSGHITYNEIDCDLLDKYPAIINTTPVGMHPLTDEAPTIPYKCISKKNILFDLVYNPEETLFLKKGKLQGAKTCNGFEMLKIQAEESWKIWNA